MISKTEIRWNLVSSAVLFVLTSVPFLLGAFFENNHQIFSGFYFGVEDGNSYIAKMLNGSMGEWLFRTPYSISQQRGFLTFLPYIVLGKFAQSPGLHEQLLALFQAFRFVGCMVMFSGTYLFIAQFIDDRNLRKVATIISVVGGGFGWIFFLGLQGLWNGRIPLEFYSPETFGFLSFLSLPHLSMARGLLLIVLAGFICQVGDKAIFNQSIAGSLLLFVGLFQPLNILLAWMLMTCLLIIVIIGRRHEGVLALANFYWKKTNLYFWIPAPLIIYSIISFKVQPFLAGWTSRNIILSPPFSDYLLSYGPLLLVAVLFAMRCIRQRICKFYVLVVWLLIFPLLIYFPHNLQRRLAEGVWIPIVIMALMHFSNSERKYLFGRIFALTSLIAPITLLIIGIAGIFTKQYPIFVDRGIVDLVRMAELDVEPDAVFIANYEMSNFLPAYFNIRTVIGHGPESVNPGIDLDAIRDLFIGEDHSSIRSFICSTDGQWLLVPESAFPHPTVIKDCCIFYGSQDRKILYRIKPGYCRYDF